MERKVLLRIRLKSNCYTNYSGNYAEKLELIKDEWIEIDTKSLFKEQLNTKPILGVTNVGLRIYQDDVEEVEDDERIGRAKCNYCGLWTDTGKPCPGCQNGSAYMKEFFPGTIRVAKTIQEEMNDILGNTPQGVQ